MGHPQLFSRRFFPLASRASKGAALSSSRHPTSLLFTLLVPALFWLGLSVACHGGSSVEQEVVFQGPTMGTQYTVKVVVGELGEERKAQISDMITKRLSEVNNKMSTYLADSELSRFNAWDELTPFSLSPETLGVMELALDVGAITSGAFDITVGSLVNAWGFGPSDPPPGGPGEEELAALREHVGFQKLEIVPGQGVRKLDVEVSCDLNAVAKGFAVDRVAEALAADGYGDFMVEVGGEVRTSGLNAAGAVWRIGIEAPQTGRFALQAVIPLADASLATSGDYRNFYELDGKRFSHTIDPRTGRPVIHNGASVSVIEEECAIADAWSTALLALGPEEGYALAVERGLAALFLIYDSDGGVSEKVTPAFDAYGS